MEWIEIVIESCPEEEDYIQNVLYSLGAQGLAIENPNDIIEMSRNQGDWDYIDLELLEMEKDVLTIKAYFEDEEDLPDKIEYIRKNVPDCMVSVNRVDPSIWEESWKKYYKPLKIGKNIIIKPSWENYDKLEGDLIINIDPGMAFGTGIHETTQMCIVELENSVKKEDFVYDIGCGSGILSIVSGKLGADKVIGMDLDSTSVRIARENVALNNLQDKIDIFEGNLFDNLNIDLKADIIVANIIAEVIIVMSKDIGEYLKEDGIFISSGIILDKIPPVEEALKSNGFKIDKTEIQGEWACIIARKI